ncbi:MAG: hypothetical protein C0501_31400 [Isosphaera sp.]|nr:hypothetical protein [Isosphaera sp.]
MNISRAIAVLLCLGGTVPVWAQSGGTVPSLAEDFQRLEGRWVKRGPGEEWLLAVQTDPFGGFQLSISVPESPAAIAKVGRLSGVQEDARGRYFELPPDEALPRRVYYRFDDDKLILDITEGPVRGQHTLVREREGVSAHSAWVIGAVVLGIVVLTVATVLVRSRMRKAAEPGAAADGGGR